jgi:hypothetical protein
MRPRKIKMQIPFHQALRWFGFIFKLDALNMYRGMAQRASRSQHTHRERAISMEWNLITQYTSREQKSAKWFTAVCNCKMGPRHSPAAQEAARHLGYVNGKSDNDARVHRRPKFSRTRAGDNIYIRAANSCVRRGNRKWLINCAARTGVWGMRINSGA